MLNCHRSTKTVFVIYQGVLVPQPFFTIQSIVDPDDLSLDNEALVVISRLLSQVTGQETTVSYEVVQNVVDDGFFLLAVSHDLTIIGMASALIVHTMGQDCLRLADLVVDESYRGQGVGRALIDEVKKHANPRDYQFVEAVVPVSQSAANRLLERQGFTLMSWASPEHGEEGLRYYRLMLA